MIRRFGGPVVSSSEIWDRYEAGVRLLDYATTGLSRVHQAERLDPDGLSIAQVVDRLVESDVSAAERIKQIAISDRPTLGTSIDVESWLTQLEAGESPLEGPLSESVALFVITRRRTLRALRDCSEATLARRGIDPDRGSLSMAMILVEAIGQLDHGLRQIYGKRGQLGVALMPLYPPRPRNRI